MPLYICLNPRVNLNANYELWVLMMDQYRFSKFDKDTTLIQNVDNGRGWVRIKGIWKLYFALIFW